MFQNKVHPPFLNQSWTTKTPEFTVIISNIITNFGFYQIKMSSKRCCTSLGFCPSPNAIWKRDWKIYVMSMWPRFKIMSWACGKDAKITSWVCGHDATLHHECMTIVQNYVRSVWPQREIMLWVCGHNEKLCCECVATMMQNYVVSVWRLWCKITSWVCGHNAKLCCECVATTLNYVVSVWPQC